MESKSQKHHHHILPTKTALMVAGALLFLTAVTVWIAHIDLGRLNFFIAMAVASVKALLVALVFMNLMYDRRENAMIFVTSFVFLAIFFILTSTDLFFRQVINVKGPIASAAHTQSKLKNPWISTPELVAKGKELYSVQCVACHGAEGHGNGPAASALNPPPRNFTSLAGWKNGRKPTMVFKTLKEGLPPSAMASYSTLPADDRWALTHYVLSIGGPALADTPADFTKAGIDPNQTNGGSKEDPTISVELAMERVATVPVSGQENAHLYHAALSHAVKSPIYQSQCIECHGDRGQGGIKVRSLGVNPVAFVTTAPFSARSESLKSQESFNHFLFVGIPGGLMPRYGDLSSSQLRDLYQFVKEQASQSPQPNSDE